ncbi:hypothetical protein BJ742DRAFT_822720 [Cladochytrium replicatum]|nr:hypothetical protein BJ742DRAFT_822720 [Cladochytrium replicatum]
MHESLLDVNPIEALQQAFFHNYDLLQTQNKDLERLSAHALALQSAIDRLRAELSKSQSQAVSASRNASDAEFKLRDALARKREVEWELSDVKSLMGVKVAQLQDEIVAGSKEKDVLEKRLEEAVADKDSQRKQFLVEQSSWKDMDEGYKKQIAGMELKFDEAVKRIEELDSRCSQTKSESGKLSEEVKNMERRIKTLTHQLSDKDKLLMDYQLSLDKAQKVDDDRVTMVSALEDQLSAHLQKEQELERKLVQAGLEWEGKLRDVQQRVHVEQETLIESLTSAKERAEARAKLLSSQLTEAREAIAKLEDEALRKDHATEQRSLKNSVTLETFLEVKEWGEQWKKTSEQHESRNHELVGVIQMMREDMEKLREQLVVNQEVVQTLAAPNREQQIRHSKAESAREADRWGEGLEPVMKYCPACGKRLPHMLTSPQRQRSPSWTESPSPPPSPQHSKGSPQTAGQVGGVIPAVDHEGALVKENKWLKGRLDDAVKELEQRTIERNELEDLGNALRSEIFALERKLKDPKSILISAVETRRAESQPANIGDVREEGAPQDQRNVEIVVEGTNPSTQRLRPSRRGGQSIRRGGGGRGSGERRFEIASVERVESEAERIWAATRRSLISRGVRNYNEKSDL